jgi:hypothetical protein
VGSSLSAYKASFAQEQQDYERIRVLYVQKEVELERLELSVQDKKKLLDNLKSRYCDALAVSVYLVACNYLGRPIIHPISH